METIMAEVKMVKMKMVMGNQTMNRNLLRERPMDNTIHVVLLIKMNSMNEMNTINMVVVNVEVITRRTTIKIKINLKIKIRTKKKFHLNVVFLHGPLGLLVQRHVVQVINHENEKFGITMLNMVYIILTPITVTHAAIYVKLKSLTVQYQTATTLSQIIVMRNQKLDIVGTINK